MLLSTEVCAGGGLLNKKLLISLQMAKMGQSTVPNNVQKSPLEECTMDAVGLPAVKKETKIKTTSITTSHSRF